MIRPRTLVLAATIMIAVQTGIANEPATKSEGVSAKAPSPDQAKLEKHFQQMLAGASLKGFFTELNKKTIDELLPDSYRIDEVVKTENGDWFFDAQVQYRGHDIPFRMPIKVKWAGDTPVITLNNMPAPGLGTFTARVMFFNNLYAGTWEGHNFRGHMYGEVVKQPIPEEGPTEKLEKGAASPPKSTAPKTPE